RQLDSSQKSEGQGVRLWAGQLLLGSIALTEPQILKANGEKFLSLLDGGERKGKRFSRAESKYPDGGNDKGLVA
ncbi:hypothetical protein chiPu_0028089, partial [Chiloscyllium punctatum]|nr:hypothetical protein [Chiloscyllium punctatum]